MGFLDHSTTNIIVDAVLTDAGRRLLARNNGTFSIVKFTFADDEVDYTQIQKYGKQVGKEKIEKNTPVFEAQTNSSIALKYKCVSLSNPFLTTMPSIQLDSSTTSVALTVGTTTSQQLTLSQVIAGGLVIDSELVDSQFAITMPNQFLKVAGATPIQVTRDGQATYIISRNANLATGTNAASVTFTIQLASISDTQFLIFGSNSNKNVINAQISVAGLTSGAVSDLSVSINKGTT